MSTVTSSVLDFTPVFKAEVEGAFADASVSQPKRRVWLEQGAPDDVPTPYSIIRGGEEVESEAYEDKRTAPVVLFPTADFWSDDVIEATRVAKHLIARMTDEEQLSAPSGWQVHTVRINFHIEISDVVSDGPKHYGRSVQFEVHLEPIS